MSKAVSSNKRNQQITYWESLRRYDAAREKGEEIDQAQAQDVPILCNAVQALELACAKPSKPGKLPERELSNSWLAEALRDASKQNNPHLFKLLLHRLLAGIGIYPPPHGVFAPFPKFGNPGRPVSSANEEIYAAWKRMDNSSMKDLAGRVFGARYRTADDAKRRNYRDQCRKAVRRAVERKNRDLLESSRSLARKSRAKSHPQPETKFTSEFRHPFVGDEIII